MTNSAVVRADVDEGLADLDDAELLDRVRRREPEAFRVLYERHRDAVSRYAYQSARGPAEADDFVSETFARVLKLLQDGKGPRDAFLPYAVTVVRNLAADRGRRSAREEVVPDPPEDADHADEMAAHVERDYVRRAFSRLPARWQRVLWLSEVEGCGPGEMATVLGVSATAAAALAYRAREGLRQAYLLAHLGADTPDACRRTVERLPAYVRTALPAATAERVMDHLDECAACRARSSEIAELDRDLRGLLLPLLLGGTAAAGGPGPAGGLAALLAAQWKRLRDLVRNPAGAVTAAGIAVVVVGALVWLAVRPASHDSTPPAAADTPPPAASAEASPPAEPSLRSAAPTAPGAPAPSSEPAAAPPEARRSPVRPADEAAQPERSPAPPSSTPSPSPTPSASCVTLLVVSICSGHS